MSLMVNMMSKTKLILLLRASLAHTKVAFLTTCLDWICLGMLSWIHVLNLSHNWLIGSIPKSLSNLSQLESLDLSYNNLSRKIPSNLTNLHFLAVFTVAQNNISGRILDMEAQFGTFDKNNYNGNPFLCEPLLKRKCNAY